MTNLGRCAGLLFLFGLPFPAMLGAADLPQSADGPVILRQRCLKCHGTDRPKGDLSLATRSGMLEGGSSGPAAVPGKPDESLLLTKVRDREMPPQKPLDAAEIAALDKWLRAGAPWAGDDKATTKDNTPPRRAGLDWWSLQPVRRPPVPSIDASGWARNAVDRFIHAGLSNAGLNPSPEADRRIYIRRVTLDLTGLLPTPDEVGAFVSDSAPDAYEKLVDRLLASPAYGESWARHWLDVIRFAESHGYEMNTLRPNAWPYRDYVIGAFNRDVPFRDFVLEQLAGDALPRADRLTQAATGFLVAGPHDLVGNETLEGKLQQRADDLFDLTATTGSALLGLTVGCARCHDHKFDPISQKDFYRLEAVFAGVQHAERPLADTDSDARRQEIIRLRSELQRLETRLDAESPLAAPQASGKPVRPAVNARRNVERFAPVHARYIRFTVRATNDGTQPCIDELEVYESHPSGENLALAEKGAKPTASSVFPNSPLHLVEHLNDGHVGNSRSWISNEPGRGWAQIELPAVKRIDRVVWGRDRQQKFFDRLPTDYRIEVSLDGKQWKAVAGSWDRLSPAGAATLSGPDVPEQSLAAQYARLEARVAELQTTPAVYAGVFREPEHVHVLKRGDPMQRLEEVGPGSLTGIGTPFDLKPGTPDAVRRRALAEWIASPANPLPARVLVNRIWHYHFGQGIVRTPSDFGLNGDRPSHPELLDWLAAEFLANGGRMKLIHRLIVLSSTYRQASRMESAGVQRDADNRLLWRFPSRRLEAEKIRDVILQVSGSLDRKMGGTGYHLWNYSGYVINFTPKPTLGPDEFRRMVYQFKPRTQADGTFGVFDCPDATAVMPRRNVSNTALQALNLLNSPFIRDQADRFAERLRQCARQPDEQVRAAFRLAFGRLPSVTEARAGMQLVQQHGLPALCRALLNANEFVIVE